MNYFIEAGDEIDAAKTDNKTAIATEYGHRNWEHKFRVQRIHVSFFQIQDSLKL